jgi:hypothetical protein
MVDDIDVVEELLGMAKEPDHFTKANMGEMILVAATEIIKLREHAKSPSHNSRRQTRPTLRNGGRV